MYCSEDVYNTYVSYNKNQEIFIKKIEQNENESSTKVVVDSTIFEEYTRPIDRPKLNLFMKMEKKIIIESEDETDSEDEESEIDGVDLHKLRNWIDGETLVGKMINYLYEYGIMSSEELKEGVEYESSDKEFNDNIKNGGSYKSQYGKLWTRKNNQISLNKNIRKYIDKIEDN